MEFFKIGLMHSIKPVLQTILFTSIPLIFQNMTPVFAFFTAVMGTVYMFFKLHNEYIIWKRRKKDNDLTH